MRGYTFFIFLAGICLATTLIADDREFSEDDIENEEALANSDAAIAEKNELRKMKDTEKHRASVEKAAAERAKVHAKEVQSLATKESDKLYKDLKAWRAERKTHEAARVAAEKDEAAQRRVIEKIKLDREKEQALVDQAKKARDDARAAYKAAVDLHKSLKLDLEKMQKDRQRLITLSQSTQQKTAALAKRNEALEKRIHANTKIPTVSAVKTPQATYSANRRPSSKVPEEKKLAQDCNLRLGPSGKAEVYKILHRGDTVVVHGLNGLWYSVGTREIEKGFISKPCL